MLNGEEISQWFLFKLKEAWVLYFAKVSIPKYSHWWLMVCHYNYICATHNKYAAFSNAQAIAAASPSIGAYPVCNTMSKFCHIRSLLVMVSQHSLALCTEGSSLELWGRKRFYGHQGIPLWTRCWDHFLCSNWLLA